MKTSKELAADHWDGYVKPLLESFDVALTNADGYNYQSAFIHGFKHGVEQEHDRARATSAAAFENLAPITAYTEAAAMDTSTGYLAFAANAPPPAREPLDLRLPSYALPCTAEEAQRKYYEEREEWLAENVNTAPELVEMWDVMQSAKTWFWCASSCHAEDAYGEAVREIRQRYEDGDDNVKRKLVGARKDMLRKNASRTNHLGGIGYYSPEVNAAIMAGTWNP